ncbi:MAG: Hpt domain-containing protein, partial [Halothiobacillaceae bacterium]
LATAGAQASLDVPRLVPEDADREVVEIFIEEAREVLETIRAQFQQWRNAPENRAALVELRRAFHTLKGSGRIIGAQLVGEFGWAFENLLNRVIEGVLSASEPLFQLLERAPGMLERLLDALEGKPGLVVAQVEVLNEAAHAFLSEGPAALNRLAGHPVSAVETKPLGDGASSTSAAVVQGAIPTPAVMDAPPASRPAQGAEQPGGITLPTSVPQPAMAGTVTGPGSQDAERGVPTPRIDPQLYAIFRSEAEGYLQVLRQAVERGYREGGLHPDGELIRVTHSLLGSARTAGAPRIVALAVHLEQAMRLAFETQQVLDASLLHLTDLAVHAIALLLDEVGG